MTYAELEDKINERMGDDYTFEVRIRDDIVEACVVLPDEIDVSLFIECSIDDSRVGLINVDYKPNKYFLDACFDLIVEFAQTPLEERYDDEED